MRQLLKSDLGSSLLGKQALISHLWSLDWRSKRDKIRCILSHDRCGGILSYFLGHCDCGVKLHRVKHKCNLRICEDCSSRKKARFRHKYEDYFKGKVFSQSNNLYFLTISPRNYDSLEEGLNHLKKSFAKFLRLDYVKSRVKGGLYVIEVTNKGKGWNVHLHAIVNGAKLDNVLRGFCTECKQNRIKKDYNDMRFYCANKKCLNKNELTLRVNDDSKIVKLFKKCSKRDVNIHITNKFWDDKKERYFYTYESPMFCVNYMLKYIFTIKEELTSIENVAIFTRDTYRRKLISKFGSFFKDEELKKAEKKKDCICYRCGKDLVFEFDAVISKEMLVKLKPPDRPKVSLGNFFRSGQ